MLPSASKVDVHVSVEISPVVILAGLNEAMQLGATAVAVPDKFTVVGVPGTPPVFDEMLKGPEKGPVVIGAKFAVMVHVPLWGMERPGVHVVDTILKGLGGLVRAGESNTRFPLPVFVTVIVTFVELPSLREPKS